MVVTDENPPAGIDVTRPSVARVYDYWLGGKDNFASDRDMGGRMAELNPALPQLVRHNREFICAAAARAAAAGISQFLDLGSGIPTVGNVHEIAQAVDPTAGSSANPTAGWPLTPVNGRCDSEAVICVRQWRQ